MFAAEKKKQPSFTVSTGKKLGNLQKKNSVKLLEGTQRAQTSAKAENPCEMCSRCNFKSLTLKIDIEDLDSDQYSQ